MYARVKVIDCASTIAGPAAATILSDLGADVITNFPPPVPERPRIAVADVLPLNPAG
jgi:crotonobetainyl-CoA:carnitine CoA-transferase CaiB-like acyl-CoA transferase